MNRSGTSSFPTSVVGWRISTSSNGRPRASSPSSARCRTGSGTTSHAQLLQTGGRGSGVRRRPAQGEIGENRAVAPGIEEALALRPHRHVPPERDLLFPSERRPDPFRRHGSAQRTEVHVWRRRRLLRRRPLRADSGRVDPDGAGARSFLRRHRRRPRLLRARPAPVRSRLRAARATGRPPRFFRSAAFSAPCPVVRRLPSSDAVRI